MHVGYNAFDLSSCPEAFFTEEAGQQQQREALFYDPIGSQVGRADKLGELKKENTPGFHERRQDAHRGYDKFSPVKTSVHVKGQLKRFVDKVKVVEERINCTGM
ncbi:hypothetical protein ON010_g6713 [Phytophthora cinnamomi]|nr:hypothetical protein ON010_g6713 [Phytophthora cinnamomi]